MLTALLLAVLFSNPELAKDINTNPAMGARSSNPLRMERAGDDVWVIGTSSRLWRVPLTGGGAPQVAGEARAVSHAGITPLFLTTRPGGIELSTPSALLGRFRDARFLGSVDGRAYLAADFQLWVTDGTVAGTRQLFVQEPRMVTTGGGAFWFYLAGTIYRSDGTTVTEYARAFVESYARLAFSNGHLFVATSQRPLQVIGPAGAREVGRVLASVGIAPVRGGVVFSSTDGLWFNDGATERRLGSTGFRDSPLTSDGTIAWLTATDGLWRTDGTTLERIATVKNPLFLQAFEGGVLFSADDPLHGVEPWISDGTTTRMLANLAADTNGDSSPSDIVRCGDNVCFLADTVSGKRTLWRSDGTPEGTYELLPAPPPQPAALLGSGSLAWFAADGKLWRTDGTLPGTVPLFTGDAAPRWGLPGDRLLFRSRFADMIADGVTGSVTPSESNISGYDPRFVGSRILVSADELRSYTGDLQSFSRLSDYSRASAYAIVDGLVWLVHPQGVMRSDGTPESLELVLPLPGAIAVYAAGDRLFVQTLQTLRLFGGDPIPVSSVRAVGSAGNRLLWVQDTGSNTLGLWSTDGTAEGTRQLLTGDSISLAGEAYGTAFISVDSRLWLTDGTPEGTRSLDVEYAGGGVTLAGRRVYFVTNTPDIGRELWSMALDDQPRLSVHDAAVNEDSGIARVAVTLDLPAYHPVTVAYDVIGGRATAGVDFVARSGTLTFEPGETRKEIAIAITPDAISEGSETVLVVLRREAGAEVLRRRGALHLDERQAVDLELVFTGFESRKLMFDIINHGAEASTVRLTGAGPLRCSATIWPAVPANSRLTILCDPRTAGMAALRVTSSETDTNPADNDLTVAWPAGGGYALAADVHQLVAGRATTLTAGAPRASTPMQFELTSSDPSILQVPPSVQLLAGSTATTLPPIRARRPGRVTIIATPLGQPEARIELTFDVGPPPTRRRTATAAERDTMPPR